MPYIGKQPANVPVTADDIPANSIDASKIIDGAITIADIADDAVTADKLANSINTAIAANTAKTGITSSQASAITANTAKTGITSSQASAITANTAKTGITSSQATAITAALPKAGGTMTGSINMIDGSEASPAIRFSDDTNTGIWSPAADTIAISANGSERMRMLSDGTLCIGETSAGLSVNTQLFVRNNAGNGYAATFLNDGNDANRFGLAIASGTDNNSGTNKAITFMDGDGTILNHITTTGSDVIYNGQNTAKAWVNFNGTGTLAVRDSHNVSSVTDNTTGQYTINFSNNMANANYCAVANVSVNVDGGSATIDSDVTLRNYATSSVKFLVYIGQGAGWTDPAIGTALVFGD